MPTILGPDESNTARINTTGYLMVCLCKEDSANIVDGPLEGADICLNHEGLIRLQSLKIPSLLHITDENGEIWPLKQEKS